jgi:hypothetical protein
MSDMCGEVMQAVFKGGFFDLAYSERMALAYRQVVPLPFVPAAWINFVF